VTRRDDTDFMADPTELLAAIRADDLDAVDRLLAADPGLASARDAEGLTPVIQARYWFKRAALDRLLAVRGDDLDIFEAAVTGRADLVRSHLARDAGLARAWSPDGFTALHYPAFFGGVDVAEALIEAGADIEAVSRNGLGARPLHSAAAGRHLDVSRLLIERGADVNASEHGGFVPLHEAAEHGDAELVELLVAAGADRDVRLDDERTAADIALEAGHEGLAERLGGPSIG
jgi:ankyrin repeat protein